MTGYYCGGSLYIACSKSRACGKHENRNSYKSFIGKPKGMKTLGRPGLREEDNIKIDLQEIR
jgi:hypothetical protein